eukprot:4552060-Pyramimonas_sp.AAC.1
MQTRVRKTTEYYNNDAMMMELPILTVLVGIYDYHLLYPMLGDPAKGANLDGDGNNTSKLDKLLSKETSLIGVCAEKLLECMKTWRAGGDRRWPWCVLDMLGISVGDLGVMRFARNQALKLAGVVFR